MIALIALVGLIIGTLLNRVIARQAVTDDTPPAPPWSAFDWVPLVGALRRRDAVALVVELIAAALAAIFFSRHGMTFRGIFLFVAALVLIDTGAVDFRVRLIDLKIILPATLLVLGLAPLNAMTRFESLVGFAIAAVIFLFFFVLGKLMFPSHAVPFGLGDIYLAAFIGALVGFTHLSVALFWGMAMAGVVALGIIIVRATGRKVPTYLAYGTYLCLGVLLFLALGKYSS